MLAAVIAAPAVAAAAAAAPAHGEHLHRQLCAAAPRAAPRDLSASPWIRQRGLSAFWRPPWQLPRWAAAADAAAEYHAAAPRRRLLQAVVAPDNTMNKADLTSILLTLFCMAWHGIECNSTSTSCVGHRPGPLHEHGLTLGSQRITACSVSAIAIHRRRFLLQAATWLRVCEPTEKLWKLSNIAASNCES